MATQYHESGQLPEGIVLAHTLHGRLDESVTHAYTAAHIGLDVQPAPYDGVPYYEDVLPKDGETKDDEPKVLTESDRPGDPDVAYRAEGREKRCWAKDDTCRGWAINNSLYCAVHSGVFRNPLGRKAWDPKFAEGDPEQES
jgi:hypothetical protein